jgi:hypothetical protein
MRVLLEIYDNTVCFYLNLVCVSVPTSDKQNGIYFLPEAPERIKVPHNGEYCLHPDRECALWNNLKENIFFKCLF